MNTLENLGIDPGNDLCEEAWVFSTNWLRTSSFSGIAPLQLTDWGVVHRSLRPIRPSDLPPHRTERVGPFLLLYPGISVVGQGREGPSGIFQRGESFVWVGNLSCLATPNGQSR
jgi:hypothetical protein